MHVPTRSIEVMFTLKDLLAYAETPRSWPIWPWVSALMHASDSGSVLTCNIGIPEARPDGGFHMNYSLFDLDVARRTLQKQVDLDDPYR